MKVYLIRHGEAEPNEDDSVYALSAKGKKEIEALAKLLIPQQISVSYFLHSGKLRAEQTANIFSQAIFCSHGVEKRQGLDPLDLVSPIAAEINQFDQDLALVGHMPFMGKLAAKLVTGYESNEFVFFQTGTILCLERTGGGWLVRWMLSPELLKDS